MIELLIGVLIGVAAWEVISAFRSKPSDEEPWLPESDPRRSWRRI